MYLLVVGRRDVKLALEFAQDFLCFSQVDGARKGDVGENALNLAEQGRSSHVDSSSMAIRTCLDDSAIRGRGVRAEYLRFLFR